MTKHKKGKSVFSLIKRKIPITFFIIVVGITCFFVGKNIGLNTDTTSSNKTVEDVEVSKQTITKSLTSSGSIEPYTTKTISLDTDYNYDSIFVEADDIVKKGAKIVKYTNGEYLKAPYDLVITSINVPSKDEMVGYNHYIGVSSNNSLSVSFKVDESKVSNITVGKSAKIKIAALDKELTGVVTKVSNTASNGKFTVTVEFDNDGTIMLGMRATVSI